MFHIELVRTLADFLVGVECYADFSVFDFWVLHQIVHRGYDFGDAGFVVGSEKGVAVGDNEILADVVL